MLVIFQDIFSDYLQPSDTHVITQFHFQQWPVNSCPNNPASIIDLFEDMERVQRKTGNGPITVHCKYVKMLLTHSET